MLKFTWLLLCISWLVVGSFAAVAPFIEKCEWNDRACLLKSTQKAIPYFADGLKEFGMAPMDPVELNTVSFNEGGLNFVFKDTVLRGLKNCQAKDVERNKEEQWIKIEMECPIDLSGNYVSSGTLLNVPVEGDGPFHIKSDKFLIRYKCRINMVDGEDGQKHWQIQNEDYTYDFLSKTSLDFENLFNGDKEKAAPVLTILEESWKEVTTTFAKPILNEVLNQFNTRMHSLTKAVPASELEK